MKKFQLLAVITLISTLSVGCSTTEEASSRFLDYQIKTDLQFPLKGESYIAWGGRTLKENAHASFKDQRFALDIVALKEGNPVPTHQEIEKDTVQTYSGDSTKNESYYIFNREVLATGEGTIVDIQNDIADNIPGKFNKKHPEGNYVVLDHGNGEFSMFAHLKYHSLHVTNGDKVITGDVLGLCGNSGNTSEPHLHYHLQNTKKWLHSEGLPAQFQNYLSNGKLVNRGEPVRGEIITLQ